MGDGDIGWFAFSGDALDDLTPERRVLAARAVARYEQRRPLGWVYVEVVGDEHGQAEVRFSSVGSAAGWETRLFSRAIAELQNARSMFNEHP